MVRMHIEGSSGVGNQAFGIRVWAGAFQGAQLPAGSPTKWEFIRVTGCAQTCVKMGGRMPMIRLKPKT